MRLSWQARLIALSLRLIEKPRLKRATNPQRLRRQFRLTTRVAFRAPSDVRRTKERLGGRHALRLDPAHRAYDYMILYFHGGGFMLGAPETHGAMLAAIARKSGIPAILPHYPLAPEHPFPAALQAARAAFQALCAQGLAPDQIILGGDSAGGGLALSLLAELCAADQRPAGLFAFSPLTDMTFSGASFRENADKELLLPATRALDMAQFYLSDHPRDDPAVSPLFATFDQPPPVWLAADRSEILLDDTRRMARLLGAKGGAVSELLMNGLPHVWPMFHNWMPEARNTLDDVAGWLRSLPHPTPGS